MNITDGALAAQAARARTTWPWIDQIEAEHRLPRCLLYAVGSRETGLTMVVGDGGHGHGIWQLDDRSHTIPPDFDIDPHLQAEVAAAMLAALLADGGDLVSALNRYNSGQPLTALTAGGNYGPDAADRMTWLQHHFEPPYVGPLLLRRTLGAEVAVWQTQMQWRGWRTTDGQLVIDGIYGPQSYTCCMAFQREHGLTADGIVGPVTWTATWETPTF